eukprot:gene17548-biopygen12889
MTPGGGVGISGHTDSKCFGEEICTIQDLRNHFLENPRRQEGILLKYSQKSGGCFSVDGVFSVDGKKQDHLNKPVSLLDTWSMAFVNNRDNAAERVAGVRQGHAVLHRLPRRGVACMRHTCRNDWSHGISRALQDLDDSGQPGKLG